MTEGVAGLPVKRIIYLAAIAPKVGYSLADTMPGPLIDALVAGAVNGYMHHDPAQLAYGMGMESWEEGYELALKLPHHSAISFTDKLTQAAYTTVPVSYIFTEQDVIVTQGMYRVLMLIAIWLIIWPEHQESYIKWMEEARGSKIDVIRKPWGTPSLSTSISPD